MKTKAACLFLCVLLMTFASVGFAEPVPEPDLPRSEAALSMMNCLESDPELMALMEKSIAAAAQINPDPDTNPVSDLESYYAFLDRCYLGLPWEIHPSGKYSSLYDQIDQGMGCLYHCRCERTC